MWIIVDCLVTVYWPQWLQCIGHLQFQIHSLNDHINLAIQANMLKMASYWKFWSNFWCGNVWTRIKESRQREMVQIFVNLTKVHQQYISPLWHNWISSLSTASNQNSLKSWILMWFFIKPFDMELTEKYAKLWSKSPSVERTWGICISSGEKLKGNN